MFPYLEKELETDAIDFGEANKRDVKYLVKGWSHSRKNKTQETFRWAVGSRSTLKFYLSRITNKVVELECIPFRPKYRSPREGKVSRPYQVGYIYVNDRLLEKKEFRKKGKYSFHIPSSSLNYGSNFITFSWKYKYNEGSKTPGVRFCQMKFLAKQNRTEMKKTNKNISFSQVKIPLFTIPPGGIIEYHVDLPQKSTLKFSLFSKDELDKDSQIQLAIYGEKGRKIFKSYHIEKSSRQREFKIKLDMFANEIAKFVFSNSIRNKPKPVVSWINPIIYTNSQKNLSSLWEIEKKEPQKKQFRRKRRDQKKYNVFIYLVDTLRADHLSCYGYDKKTSPFIDEFSKEGVLFKKCFANASWTKPTVGSILTGLYPNRHKAETAKDKLPNEVVLLSEILKSQDYYTVHISTNPYITEHFNFIQDVDFYKSRPKYHRSSEYVNSVFFNLIESNPHLMKKPIFAYLHTMDPHYPYEPEKPFLKFKKDDKIRDRLPLRKIFLKKLRGRITENDIDYVVSLYDCEILQNDYYFREFIDFLKKKGLYEDSMIIFIADHGEQFNEHGGIKHGSSIYNEEIHIPLIVKFPNSEFSGLRSDLFVSQVDILPTILDYLSIENSSKLDGVSILSQIKNPEFQRNLFIREKLRNINLVGFINSSDEMKHIFSYHDKYYTGAKRYEKYSLEKDFSEVNNLYKGKTLFAINSIKFKIDNLLEEMEKSALVKAERVDYKKLDPETIRILKTLGYIK